MPTEVCQVCYLLVDKAGPSGDHVASVMTMLNWHCLFLIPFGYL